MERRQVLKYAVAAAVALTSAVAGRRHKTYARTIDDGMGPVSRVYAVRVGVPPTSAPTVTTFWVGNTLPGFDASGGGDNASAPSVAQNAFAGWVKPDGTVITLCYWDEGTKEGCGYKDGAFVGGLQWGHFNGGWAITGDNAGFLYAAMRPNGATPDVIRKYDDTLTADSGRQFGWVVSAGNPLQVAVHSAGTPRGLAVVGSELFVAVPEANAVDVHQTSNLAYLRTFTVSGPTRMAGDGTRLWIATAGQVKAYTTAGVATGAAVADVVDPTAVAVAPDGTLLVGDDGQARQQVSVYDITGTPTRTDTIGVAGGMFSTPAGGTGELRFNGIVGVGKSTGGTLYVVQDHPGFPGVYTDVTPDNTGETHGTGANIEAYTFSAGAWHRSWQLLGLEFVDGATVDPYTATATAVDVYSADEHYQVDLTTGAWTWAGHTTDRFARPTDLRFQDVARVPLRIVLLGGVKFLICTDMGNGILVFYSLSGEQATQQTTISGGCMSVDADGHIWGRHDDHLYRRAFTGLTGGVPQYAAEASQGAGFPAPFTYIGRIRYDVATDSLYAIGFTTARPNWAGSDKVAGTVLARYDNWVTSGNRTATWTVDVPSFTGSDLFDNDGLGVVAIDQAGGMVFGTMLTSEPDPAPRQQTKMFAWSAATGVQVAAWFAGATVGSTGWVDTLDGVNATRLPNGDTVVFQEEDFRAKILGYRLR